MFINKNTHTNFLVLRTFNFLAFHLSSVNLLSAEGNTKDCFVGKTQVSMILTKDDKRN